METSIFLARVLGLYFVIISLFALIRYKLLASMISELTSNRNTTFLIGLITLILGILLVVSHNVWVPDWTVIITIIAWLVFIGGIIRIFFVDTARMMGEWWLKHPGFLIALAIIYLIVGLYLLYVSVLA